MHMLVSMYYCIYMFSYGPYGPEIKHYYYYYYYYYNSTTAYPYPHHIIYGPHSGSHVLLRYILQTAHYRANTVFDAADITQEWFRELECGVH